MTSLILLIFLQFSYKSLTSITPTSVSGPHSHLRRIRIGSLMASRRTVLVAGFDSLRERSHHTPSWEGVCRGAVASGFFCPDHWEH
ncbi:uncharacterized protein ARMOST_12512 [Armillaria ostoyae]|uniref:Secreted protein n=1 Tax=Armillaria ostoyae TaxID=47428 RepID=A0A284RK52_ARMOS|nr:uncharacterized protein ARMOST_12512 [Armillaria ostoyae]